MLSMSDFEQGMEDLAHNFRRKVTDAAWSDTVRLYYRRLSGLTTEQWGDSVTAALEGENYFPTIKKLLDYSGKVRTDSEAPLCRMCRMSRASYLNLCGQCALENRVQAGLGRPLAWQEDFEDGLDAYDSARQACPRRDGEDVLTWLDRIVSLADGVPEGDERVPGMEG